MNRTPIRHKILQAMRDQKISRTQPMAFRGRDTFYWIPEDGQGLGARLQGTELRAARELHKARVALPSRGLGPSMYNPRVMVVTFGGDELLADWDQDAKSEQREAQRRAGI